MHLEIKALTNKERLGHQKSLSSRALVLKHPACPVVGELCMEQVMAIDDHWSYASHLWMSEGTGGSQVLRLQGLEVPVGLTGWRTESSGLGQGPMLG